ncbi:MAG: alpha/beta hydrolase [Deltaproteobacteria bacterium]|nr:alpha/beta hydrolase [Deltaproteobacteria bacterium]
MTVQENHTTFHMVEEKIAFHSDTIQIEGLVYLQDGDKAAVITHPHPLYGGSMYNQVVEIMTTVYQKKGFSTLRFNFRGVGSSQGNYDQGEGEREDVRSALHYLHERGKSAIDLAGYSFGAWVNARIMDSEPLINRIIMVSPPVAFLDFSSLAPSPKIRVVIAGERDEIAPAERIRDLVSAWNPAAHFEVIEGANHLYFGRIDTLYSVLSRVIG